MVVNLFGKEIHVEKKVLVVLVIFATTIIGLIGVFISRGSGQVIIEKSPVISTAKGETPISSPKPETQSVQTLQAESTTSSKSTDEIKVYVVGCVQNPGIVTLKKDQIIDDAIKGAGGTTPDADLSSINLVYKLKENMMLRVLSKKEQQSAKTSEAGQGVQIIKDSGGAVTDNKEVEKASNGKININTASVSELDSLPGIGSGTAKDIVDYREKNGLFKSINDIMKVAGIKESRFSKIKEFITAE